MGSANKCCFFIKLDLGCALIALVSLFVSTSMTIASAVLLILNVSSEDYYDLNRNKSSEVTSIIPLQGHGLHSKQLLNLELSHRTMQIVLWSALITGLLLSLASILLIIGLRKSKHGFVLYYFGFGIFFTILSQLGGLLLMLQKQWIASVVIFLASIAYVHFLVIIHTVYERMLRGEKIFDSSSMERLVEEDILSTASFDANDFGSNI